MSLTIDQILAESRDEISSPQTFNLKKEASAQPSISSENNFSNDDIEKMAGLLREAEISETIVLPESSMNEKIAEALILSQALHAISENKVQSNVNKESEKIASFREQAIKAGYSAVEVNSFIEKSAGMNMWGSLIKSPITKGLAALGALGAAGAIGDEIGETRTENKAKKVIKLVGQQAYGTGLKRGYGVGMRAGFVRGANQASSYYTAKNKTK